MDESVGKLMDSRAATDGVYVVDGDCWTLAKCNCNESQVSALPTVLPGSRFKGCTLRDPSYMAAAPAARRGACQAQALMGPAAQPVPEKAAYCSDGANPGFLPSTGAPPCNCQAPPPPPPPTNPPPGRGGPRRPP